MVPRIDIRSLWELFFSIRPVLKKALPKDVPEDSLPEQEHSSWIRFTFKSIPLAWPDEGQERQKLEHPSLHRPLMNLLTAIENIVLDKIQRGNGYDTLERLGNDKLRSNFPNLALMQQMMLAGSRVNGIQHTRQPKMQRKTLRKLARYVNFTHAQEEIVPKAANLRSAIGNVEKTLAKADDDDIDKARHLTQNEADFVQRAYYWKTKYQELYTALIRSISCSGGHQAQLHLSGFLADETFELLIQDCETEHWNSAKYRWVTVSPNAPGRSYNPIICSKSRDETNKGYQSTSIHQRGGWNDEIQNDGVPNPPQGTKLRDFIVHTPSKMSRQEKGVVQLLLACSLLCLYKSNWVQMGFDTNAISVPVGKTGSDGLARWRPHISCSLETVDRRGNMDDAVLSFGMLLMEMEAGKAAEPTEEDRDWSRERFSQDSTLKRILKEWRGDVQDGYRAVATRCLKFSEKADGHHDPGLKAESQRIGAIYSYILAPLCYVVGQNFKDTPKLFNTIPNTAWDQPFPNNHGASLPWFTSEITLFDGTEVTRPTDEQILHAHLFFKELKRFTQEIEYITEDSKYLGFSSHAEWRRNKIRIAIIDTGIDTDRDHFLRAAHEDRRIAECCGFVNDSGPDPNDYADTHGHGTHVARLILETAPSAEVIIAKIANEDTISPKDVHRIARAIKWAIEKEANMISLSLGLNSKDNDIEREIDEAVGKGISIFAAASNEGGNRSRTYPANKSDLSVLCIHASDGMGNDGRINPTPVPGEDNFSTLGIGISSRWKGKEKHISGTSFATPIAAGLVANVLEFARIKCHLDEHQQRSLHRSWGVRKVLRLMVGRAAGKRGGYDYVVPASLATEYGWEEKLKEEILRIVRDL